MLVVDDFQLIEVGYQKNAVDFQSRLPRHPPQLKVHIINRQVLTFIGYILNYINITSQKDSAYI